jgi:hypothetical protein
VFAESTATDVTLNTSSLSGGTCSAGTQAFSALSQYGVGPSVASWNDAAADGTTIGGALVLSGAPGNGINPILTAPQNGTVSGGSAIGSASNQVNIDSLNIALAFIARDVGGRRRRQHLRALQRRCGDGRQVHVRVDSLVRGRGSLAAYTPSHNHRAMTLGPDNALYLATASGFVRFDPVNNTSFSNGSTPY